VRQPEPEDEQATRIARAGLGALLDENAQLRAQVTALQAHSAAMVSMQLSQQVRAFHAKYRHPTRSIPCVPEMKEVQFRLNLIAEEFFELLAACEIWPHLDKGQHHPGEIHASEIIKNAIRDDFAGTVDLPEFVDALADLSYVIEGTAAAMGVNMTPVLAEVQRANMSKEPNGPDAKPVKLPDWTPPDIARVLIQQGWLGHGGARPVVAPKAR
jgi:predicted HAD superfamily Cof-like phosphohydrolase